MCVEGVPYTLLSVPTDAKFAVVVPEGVVVPPSITSVPVTGGSGTSTPSATGTATVAASVTSAPSTNGTMTPQASIGAPPVPVTGDNDQLGQMPTQNSCTGLGVVSGVQLIMCTGPEGHAFTLYVRNSSGTQTYHGSLWDCSAMKTPVPNLAPSTATPTSQPTTLPVGTLPATLPPATPTP